MLKKKVVFQTTIFSGDMLVFGEYSISWNYPPPSNIHQEDFLHFFSRESQPKPSFVTVTGWGVDQKYIFLIRWMGSIL